jgi:hypothetical protein
MGQVRSFIKDGGGAIFDRDVSSNSYTHFYRNDYTLFGSGSSTNENEDTVEWEHANKSGATTNWSGIGAVENYFASGNNGSTVHGTVSNTVGGTTMWGGEDPDPVSSSYSGETTYDYSLVEGATYEVDYRKGVSAETTTNHMGLTVTNTFPLVKSSTRKWGWSLLTSQTIAGLVAEYATTIHRTFTTPVTVTGGAWSTARSNGERVRTSAPTTLTMEASSFRVESHTVFGMKALGPDHHYGFSTETWEADAAGQVFAMVSFLEPVNSKNELGVVAWANTLSPVIGVPQRAYAVKDAVELLTARGASWCNTTSSRSDYRIVVVDAVSSGDGDLRTVTATVGSPAKGSYNVPGSDGLLVSSYGPQSFTETMLLYPRDVTDLVFSTQVVASTVGNTFVGSKNGRNTTMRGSSLVGIISTGLTYSWATLAWPANSSLLVNGSSTYPGGGFAITAETMVERAEGEVEGVDMQYYGLIAMPSDPVGVIGQLDRAIGYHPFYATSGPASNAGTVYLSSSVAGTSRDSNFSGDFASVDGAAFHTEGAGARETILDITCPITASWVSIKQGAQRKVTVTTTTGTTTLSSKIVGYDNEDGNETSSQGSLTFSLYGTTTGTTDWTYPVWGTQKWIAAPLSDRKESSRAARFTVRDESWNEARGTRTFVLMGPVQATDADWTSHEIQYSSGGDNIGWAHAGHLRKATLTWRGLHLDVTYTDTSGGTGKTTLVDSGGKKVGSFNMSAVAGAAIRTQAMVFCAVGGEGHYLSSYLTADLPFGISVVGQSKEDTAST